jgi:hypothetical protein
MIKLKAAPLLFALAPFPNLFYFFPNIFSFSFFI